MAVFRGNPKLGAVAVHINKRHPVVKVDDQGGTGTNMSQLASLGDDGPSDHSRAR
jgi:hypothetical protein